MNSATFESSLPGVYAGGDVADDGPSSIVNAAADGKVVADAIIASTGRPAIASPNGHEIESELHDLVIRRARREWRVPVKYTPVMDRMNFNEPIITYTPEEAMAEASRCLDCHEICSLCVGVCPNMALMTYEMEPFRVELPTGPFIADQRYQIAVLTDFCNECGNCTTFCPTAGEPYRDKPRLYLDREDFESQTDNAFMMMRDGDVQVMEGRWAGETHRIELNGDLRYVSPEATVRLDPGDFTVLDGEAPALEPAAAMYVLLRGVADSMPHIPWATSEPGTRLAHPGYAE